VEVFGLGEYAQADLRAFGIDPIAGHDIRAL
jgi:hypothetical protein